MAKKYDVYISSSRKDAMIAYRIDNVLCDNGFSCFMSHQDVEHRTEFPQSIKKNIDNSKLFLCVLSENAYDCEYVIKELEYALSRKNTIVLPVIVDNSQLPNRLIPSLTECKILKWSFWEQHNIEAIIRRDVNHALGRAQTSTRPHSMKTPISIIGGIVTAPFVIIAAPFIILAREASSIIDLIKGQENDTKQESDFYRTLAHNNSHDNIWTSIFAPAEVKRKSHMLVQVYLHLFEDEEEILALAQEAQKNVERKSIIPLQCKLKTDDKVDVQLSIYGETLLMSDKKSIVWQGSFTKCSFDYFVPKDIDVDDLSCVALLSVNGVPVGEMQFITKIVESPRKLNPEVIAHKYNKVFISYSHQDESKVKFLHEGLELGDVPHFFDRKYLKTGDVFPQVIKDYINSADLFILCWSENASKSEYVQKERLQALERAFPQVQPEKAAKLRIYPMSIEPHAELPSDMKDNYHFGEL